MAEENKIILEDRNRSGIFFFIAAGGFLFFIIVALLNFRPGIEIVIIALSCCSCSSINAGIVDRRKRYAVFSDKEIILAKPKWFGGTRKLVAPIEGLKAIEVEKYLSYDRDDNRTDTSYTFTFMYPDKTLISRSFPDIFGYHEATIEKITQKLREVVKINKLVFVGRKNCLGISNIKNLRRLLRIIVKKHLKKVNFQ